MNKIKELIPYILIILAVLLIKTFVVSPVKVNGLSMYNTLHDGDIMILNKIVYKFSKIKRFDIVVARWKDEKLGKDEYLIKRVIALPGETVEFKGNILYINGKKLDDPYGYGNTNDFSMKDFGKKKIPKGYYLILGDNRENSVDSRYFGLMSEKNIKGRCKLIIFPFSRAGTK